MRTLVIQSCREHGLPAWQQRCLDSVRCWSRRQGFDHLLLGDEIFELVPDWYRDKVGSKLPVATDYARLRLIRRALQEQGYARALWLDADTLIFQPDFSVDFAGSCAFGQEIWLQREGEAWRARRNVHNALCAFTPGCPVLPFLEHCTLSLLRRVDADHLSPQFVGPRLLNALHTFADFSLLPQAGALSPPVLADLANGGGAALDLQRAKSPVPLQAANLCASLIDDATADRAVAILLARQAL